VLQTERDTLTGENMKYLIAVAAVAAANFALPSFAATEAECAAQWDGIKKANADVLTDSEGQRYSAAMRVRDYKLPADGKLTRTVFMDACKADVYMTQAPDSGAPLKGANSFTEGQAKDRAMARGYTSVSDLKKDGDGIWRGNAMLDGKNTQVAIDFKGNVVASQ
jgi:hypothetical protein